MGWWKTDREGHSLVAGNTGMYWGDGPADVLDSALKNINEQFLAAFNRPPTIEEIIAGVKFSGVFPDHCEIE